MAISTIIITATRSGTPSTLIVNRGPAGPQGEPGTPGEDGAPGADGSDASVTNANVTAAMNSNRENTRSALGQQRKTVMSPTLATSTELRDVVGMTYALAAATWYKLELGYRYTSTTSGLSVSLITTGTFVSVEPFGGAFGPVAANAVILQGYPFSSTRIVMRGANSAARVNAPGFAAIWFKTDTAGTGKIAIALDSGTGTATLHEIIGVISEM